MANRKSKGKDFGKVYSDEMAKKPKSTIRIDKDDYAKVGDLNVDDVLTFVIESKVTEIARNDYEGREIHARLEIQSLKEK